MKRTNIGNRSNIQALLDVIQDLELQELLRKLDIQHGSFCFDEPVAIAVRDESPTAFLVLEITATDTEPGSEYDERSAVLRGRFQYDEQQRETTLLPDEGLLAGELARLASFIPEDYIDPEAADEAWRKLDGNHVCEDIDGNPVVVFVDQLARKITIRSKTEYTYTGRAADRMIMEACAERKDTDARIQYMYDDTGIDLPF